MRVISYDEFKSNSFCSLILDIYYSELQNKGHRQFDENFNDRDFLKVFSLIFNQFYLIKNNKIRVIDFKADFEKFKESSVSGSVNLELKDGGVKKFICYKGEFVLYSALINSLFLNVFEEEINNEDKVCIRINEVVRSNYKDLECSPINYFVFQPIYSFFSNCGFTGTDILEYAEEILELIKQHDKENELSKEKDLFLDNLDVEDLTSKGQKLMMMKELGVVDFLIDKYFKMGDFNINHLSNVIHCCTGLGVSTIQSVLNPIYNTSNDQKNNPYSYEKNLDKVKAKMLELHLED